jgi:predicted nuclease of predicted toxin-antitoxin system
LEAGALRFYLDKNLPVEIARQLQTRDIDVITVREVGALGDTDENHLTRATEMGRVLCTYDTDYVALATKGIEHAGIVIGQPESHRVGEWVN